MAVVVDLDVNRQFIRSVTYCEDLRMAYPKMKVTWDASSTFSLTTKDSLVFMGMEFHPVSIRVAEDTNKYTYTAVCYPLSVLMTLDKLCLSLSDLADFMKLPLVDGADNLKFTFPVGSVTVAAALYKYRYQSFEENVDNPSESFFIFMGLGGLDCGTFKSLPSRGKTQVHPLAGTFYSMVGDISLSRFNREQAPKPVSYLGWLNAMFGTKAEVSCAIALPLARAYSFTDASFLSALSDLVLVRRVYNSREKINPWTLTFAQVKDEFFGSWHGRYGVNQTGIPAMPNLVE